MTELIAMVPNGYVSFVLREIRDTLRVKQP